jgi:putative FmdB family regulatory protein
MPMFEYTCRACSHEFETLVRTGEAPTCAQCASPELDKKLSVFAAGKGEAAELPAGCGACGNPGGTGCALN